MAKFTAQVDFQAIPTHLFVAESGPTPPVTDANAVVGMLWNDTSLAHNSVMKYWDGDEWVRMDGGGDIPNGMILDRHIAANAAIQWSKVAHPTDLATTGDVSAVTTNLNTVAGQVTTLIGGDTNMSARAIAEDAINDAGLSGSFVTVDTDQNVGGNKTFTGNVIVPVGDNPTEAVQLSQLTAEVIRATAAEGTNATAITTERDRATAAEGGLRTDLTAATTAATALTGRVTTAEGEIATLQADDTAAQAALATLNGTGAGSVTAAVAAERTRATGAEGGLGSRIDDEVTARTAADTANTTAITAEVSRAEAAESDLAADLAAEVTRAEGAEGTLRGRLDTAENALGTVDSRISTAVGTETTAREAADTALDGRLDTLEGRDATVDDRITDAVTAERDRAVGIEQGLDGRVSTLEGVDNLTQAEFNTFNTANNAALANKADLVNGVLRRDQIPALTVTSTHTYADIAARDAATGNEEGDLAIVTGVGSFFMDADGHWVEVTAPSGAASGADLASEIARAEAAEAQLADDLAAERTARTNGDAAERTYVDGRVTTLQNADTALGGRIDTEATARADGDAANAAAVATEATRAQGIEGGLRTDLTTEVTRATGAEGTLTTNLQTEVTRATGVEGGLRTDLTAEVARATAAEGVNAAAVTAEVTRAETAEGVLDGRITTEVAERTTADNQIRTDYAAADSAIEDDLAAEVTRATDAEGTLTTNLATEATARSDADSSLGVRIDGVVTSVTSEVTARVAGDSHLQSEIDAINTALSTSNTDASTLAGRVGSLETSRTSDEAAISALQAADITEATNRANADSNLQSQLSTLQGDASTVGSVASAVAQEAAARASQDTALNNSITAEITNRTNADTALNDAISGEAAARLSADNQLRTDFGAADTTLRNDMTNAAATEHTARVAAESGLQTDINTRALDANVVHLTGDEAVGGTKTFTTNPQVPGGTGTQDAVNFGQISALVAAGAYDDSTVRGLITTAQSAADAAQADVDAFEATKGQSNGLASLGADGKVPTTQLPSLALTNVSYYATMADRDAATGIDEGDVAIVGDNGSGVRQSFIWDGAANSGSGGWVSLSSPADVTEAELAAAVTAGIAPVTARIDALGAGAGMARTGDRFDVVGTTGRILVGDSVDIDPAYVGQGSITTVGTITNGTWHGAVVDLAHGGTGIAANSLDDLVTQLGINVAAPSLYAQTLTGMVEGTPMTVTHGLGGMDVVPSVRSVTTGEVVFADVVVVDANTVTVLVDASYTNGDDLRITLVGGPVETSGSRTGRIAGRIAGRTA